MSVLAWAEPSRDEHYQAMWEKQYISPSVSLESESAILEFQAVQRALSINRFHRESTYRVESRVKLYIQAIKYKGEVISLTHFPSKETSVLNYKGLSIPVKWIKMTYERPLLSYDEVKDKNECFEQLKSRLEVFTEEHLIPSILDALEERL